MSHNTGGSTGDLRINLRVPEPHAVEVDYDFPKPPVIFPCMAELRALQDEFDEFVFVSKETEQALTSKCDELDKGLNKAQAETASSKLKIRDATEATARAMEEVSKLREQVKSLHVQRQMLEVLRYC
jgi:hypothetical protein